jgi:peptidoglycan hydrolase CwlO-like protein
MQNQLNRRIVVVLAALLVIAFCLTDVGAQTRKKRRTRRVKRPVITNPAIYEPAPASDTTGAGEDKIISTAGETPADPDQSPKTQPKKTADEAEMQQTINRLGNQVDRLSDQLSQKEELERDRLDMERLTRAEQRAESLRAQLIDVETKLGDLSIKVDQLDYMLKPENIDRATQGGGTVHPEDARDTRRRQLENEKARAQAQIKLLETSRARLEPSIATADSEVDMLRAKMQQRREDQNAAPAKPEAKPVTTRRKP